MQSVNAAEHRALFERTGVDQYVDTAQAATLLGVAPQTMRRWSCDGSGPIRPRKMNGRLRWSVAEIQAVLSGAASAA
jgi:predicted site-specific integrase-resolvase